MAIPVAGYDYEADAIADGVLHYWPMYDLYTVGQCVDTIGGENINVYNDAGNNTLVQSMFGYCRDLTINGLGSNHSVIVHAADTTNATTLFDWTVSLWFSPDVLNIARVSTLINMAAAGAGFHAYFDYPISVVTLNIIFSQTAPTITYAVSPTVGNNHLLTISSSSTTGVKVYIDNVLAGSNAATQDLAIYDKRWYLGDSSSATGSNEYFDGRLDEVAIFDHELDATDRATLWNAGAGIVDNLIKFANKPRIIHYETAGLNDIVERSFSVIAADILGGNVVNNGALRAIAVATDTPDVGDSVVAIMRALPLVGETSGLDGVYTENLRMGLDADEQFGFITSFSVSGETYDGVVMNTQNNAVTEYDQVPYNSIAKIDTGVYAVADGNGIYYMEGDLDDTANIDAYITTKLMNFGESKFKRVERAYVAMSNNGPMVLKVITRNALGTLTEDWYELSNTSDTMRVDRIKIGKGLKSHYWQFTLANSAGADFDLSELNFKQIKLSRRV